MRIVNAVLIFYALIIDVVSYSSSASIPRSDSLFFNDEKENSIIVYHSNDRVFLKKPGSRSLSATVTGAFNRSNVVVRCVRDDEIPSTDSSVLNSTAEAVFGFFVLPSGCFLALVTKSVPAYHIGPSVKEIKEVDLVLVPETNRTVAQSNSQRSADLTLLRKTFARHDFYYSSGQFDATRSYQSNVLHPRNNSDRELPYNDNLFFWNWNLVLPFDEATAYEWITPISNAWSSSKEIIINGDKFALTIVSRRSRRMQGPRYIYSFISYLILIPTVCELFIIILL